MNFDEAFARLIDARHEGQALDLTPSDRGNWTGGAVGLGTLKGSRFGISSATYPGEDIANLTIERARQLYLRDFWSPAGCEVVPDPLKFDLFDMAVNSGVRNAVRTLQKAVGEPADGVLGPHTLQAIQSVDPLRLVARFGGARLDFLSDTPAWVTESRGMAKRIAANLMAS